MEFQAKWCDSDTNKTHFVQLKKSYFCIFSFFLSLKLLTFFNAVLISCFVSNYDETVTDAPKTTKPKSTCLTRFNSLMDLWFLVFPVFLLLFFFCYACVVVWTNCFATNLINPVKHNKHAKIRDRKVTRETKETRYTPRLNDSYMHTHVEIQSRL